MYDDYLSIDPVLTCKPGLKIYLFLLGSYCHDHYSMLSNINCQRLTTKQNVKKTVNNETILIKLAYICFINVSGLL